MVVQSTASSLVDIGFNGWSSMPGPLLRETWASKSVGIYYMKRKAFGSKFSLNYGVGLGLEKIGLGDSSTLASQVTFAGADGDSIADVGIIPNPENFRKNKLAITYLDIPFEFRFHPTGTEEGEGFFMSAGGILGVRLTSHTKWKYQDNGETVRQKITGRFNLNNFRYGYQFRLGFRGVHLFYKQYLSDVFRDEFADGSTPTMTTIGINLTGF